MKKGPEVKMLGVSKSFGDTRALINVDFTAQAGRVNAIIGENGAGKSTLMKLLFGLLKADKGSIEIDGQNVPDNYSPAAAIHAGLGMLQQHFCLIPEFTVMENLILGEEPAKGGVIDFAQSEAKLKKILAELGCNFSLSDKVASLSVPQCQLIEIARMIFTGARLMIFDEPTASLAPQEVEKLYNLLGELSAGGATIILITHRLGEVMKHADFVTVLRKGKATAHYAKSEMTEEKLINSIIDDEAGIQYSRPAEISDSSEEILKVKDLSCRDSSGKVVLRHVNICLRRGEVIGIAGVTGSGQKELATALLGIEPNEGRVVLGGIDVSDKFADRRRKAGMAYIPEDRFNDGVISRFSMVLNCLLGEHKEDNRRNAFGYKYTSLKGEVSDKIRNYQIRAGDPDLPLSSMSGGNQQKLMLARELDRLPKVVIAHGPTRGLDVAAASRCYEKIVQLVEQGTAVILFSTELDDLLRYSHNIAVLYGGSLIHAGSSEELTAREIGLLMTRGAAQEVASVN
jgi:ABC-type uncharacterized transport system ATPase subunit